MFRQTKRLLAPITARASLFFIAVALIATADRPTRQTMVAGVINLRTLAILLG